MADPEEKNVINGRVIPMENYGTLQNPEEDRIHILEEDELVSDLLYLTILHEKVLWESLRKYLQRPNGFSAHFRTGAVRNVQIEL